MPAESVVKSDFELLTSAELHQQLVDAFKRSQELARHAHELQLTAEAAQARAQARVNGVIELIRQGRP